MLLRLMPHQTVRLWGEIKPFVMKALPAEERSPEGMVRLLENLSAGAGQCWLSYDAQDPEKLPNAIAITSVVTDMITGSKNLLLYSVSRILDLDEETTKRMWMEAFVATSKFAIKNGCNKIIATTDLDYIVDLARSFNGEVRSLITFPIARRLQWEEAAVVEAPAAKLAGPRT